MTAENNISKIDMKVFIQGNVRSRQLFGEKNTEYLPKTEYTISGFQGNDYILTAGKMDSLVAKEDYDKAMLNGDAVETNTSKQTFRMYEYDVWGNNEDGYEVNNIFKTSTTIKLSEDMTDEQIIESLKEHGVLNEKANKDNVSIDGEFDYTLLFNDLTDQSQKPLLELRNEM